MGRTPTVQRSREGRIRLGEYARRQTCTPAAVDEAVSAVAHIHMDVAPDTEVCEGAVARCSAVPDGPSSSVAAAQYDKPGL